MIHTQSTATSSRITRAVRAPLLAILAYGGIHGGARADPADAIRTGSPAPDKSAFNLLHPTPREWMREMSTDRPDQTESPYSVDAGHYQVEMDIVNPVIHRNRDQDHDLKTTTWGSSVNLKAGLLNNVDLQFVLDPYGIERVEDRTAGTVERTSGVGELQTRLKINLWGNDVGTSAFAIMPYIKWPLPKSNRRDGEIEGGVIFILGHQLPAGWSATLMTEFDLVSDGGPGRQLAAVNSATFSHDIVGKLAGYVEFYSVVGQPGDTVWLGQADVGFTYSVTADMQIDLGCNFGVTRSAPDLDLFLGLSYRY